MGQPRALLSDCALCTESVLPMYYASTIIQQSREAVKLFAKSLEIDTLVGMESIGIKLISCFLLRTVEQEDFEDTHDLRH